MSSLYDIVDFNKEFVKGKKYEVFETTKFPNKKMVVLSCMDTRLTELLPKALNLKNGDAKFIKNAGAVVTHPFGSIMRSILVAIYELNAEEVFVVGHLGCGMSSVDTKSIINKALKSGITEKTLNTLEYSGVDLNSWLHGIGCVHESAKNTVGIIKNHPLLPPYVRVHGLIMDPKTGEIEVVVDGNKKESNIKIKNMVTDKNISVDRNINLVNLTDLKK